MRNGLRVPEAISNICAWYHSLGNCILEPIYSILSVESANLIRLREATGVKEKLLNRDYASYVKSHIGDTIADVTVTCLPAHVAYGIVGRSGSREVENGGKLQERLFNMAAKRLQQ
jgi:hypothetical protein